jgi:organic radical activating enzyme
MRRKKNKIPIKELFFSVQGEGPNTGRAALFIRVAGCNLACPFCDTKFARERRFGKELRINSLRKSILELFEGEHRVEHVVITGGEPSLYRKQLRKLFCGSNKERLREKIKSIDIETNGYTGIDWDFLIEEGYKVTICCSPKFRYEYKKNNELSACKASYIFKLPVLDLVDAYSQLLKLTEKFGEEIDADKIYLQPISEDVNTIRELVEARVLGCRLSIQVHKIFGWR